MVLRHVLVVLPVLRRSYDQYYSDHEKDVAKKKPEMEELWEKPFEQWPRDAQIRWQEEWFWPPWLFNDTIGFLEVGSDGGSCLVGELFLKRKCFPTSSRQRRDRRRAEEVVYCCEIPKREVELSDNESYMQAALGIIADTRAIVRKRHRTAEVWLPNYDLACLDMARADQQSRERKAPADVQ